MIYKTYDDWTKDNFFNFIISDKYFIDHLETVGKLRHENGKLYSDLRLFKRDWINFQNKTYLDSLLQVNIRIGTDSIWINSKLLKKDKTGWNISKIYRILTNTLPTEPKLYGAPVNQL